MASSRVSFADGFPFLLASRASLEEVQKSTDVDVRGVPLRATRDDTTRPLSRARLTLCALADSHEPVPAEHCCGGLPGL